MDLKNTLRQRLLQQQANLPTETVRQVSSQVAAHVMEYLDPAGLRSAHLYTAVTSRCEIDTNVLAEAMRNTWPEMHMEFGIARSDAPFPTQTFDIIFIPMLGFDRYGFRLGMGGGWYDRWLAAQPHALKIGLAYASAEIDHLPHDHYDIPMDIIVTETGVREF
ncbi:5-formyltetrahydrofolate cyclo-ligase [Candidatus Saccharibacteria bacterium]|nr:5-formyltetrahydrofolate cyclo-ligase [Candidatus Saccharibacteria bacterium]